jgi:mercuric ion transport protein
MMSAAPDNGGKALAVGGLAAVLASACCLGPLLLLMLGISGAWIAQLSALEVYRPLFVGVAVLALAIAGRRIFSPAATCRNGAPCTGPRWRRTSRALFWLVAALLLLAVGFPYLAPHFY